MGYSRNVMLFAIRGASLSGQGRLRVSLCIVQAYLLNSLAFLCGMVMEDA